MDEEGKHKTYQHQRRSLFSNRIKPESIAVNYFRSNANITHAYQIHVHVHQKEKEKYMR